MSEFSYTHPEVTNVIGLVDTLIRHKEHHEEDRGYEIYHPSAFGKAQPLTSIVQTPNGPVTMADIKVGDVVCGVDGDVNTVVAIHPRGDLMIYNVIFSDGDEAQCCAEHLWEVDSRYMGFKNPKIMSLCEIQKDYIPSSGHRHYQVRVPKPIFMNGSWSSVVLPYSMGVLIGDGCFRCACPMLTSNDEEVIQRVSAELSSIGAKVKQSKSAMQYRICGRNEEGRNIVKQELIRLGLFGVKSSERFIPAELLYSDIDSRWRLLQGLMDSDGTVSKQGHPSFTTISPSLAQQVAWLIKSLGGLARINLKSSKCNGILTGSTGYTIHIAHKEPEKLFYLKRKQLRAQLQTGRRVNRNIREIVEIGIKPCQCITVSNSNGLYLTDNCIVTHNCLRLMQYQRYEARGLIKGEKEKFTSKKLRLFANGHQIHARWAGYFEELGVLRGVWECKNEMCRMVNDDGTLRDIAAGPDTVAQLMGLQKKSAEGFWQIPYADRKPRKYGEGELQGSFKPEACVCGCTHFKYHEVLVEDKELNFRGHADIILDFSKFDPSKFTSSQKEGVSLMFDVNKLPKGVIVVDMKSVGTNQYKNTVLKTGAHKYYQIQLTIYVNVLKCDYGMLWYEEKDQFDTSVFKIEKNPEWWAKIRKQALTMQDMANGEKKLLPPPRPISKSCSECEYCAFSKFCKKEGGIWDAPDLAQKRMEFYGELL